MQLTENFINSTHVASKLHMWRDVWYSSQKLVEILKADYNIEAQPDQWIESNLRKS